MAVNLEQENKRLEKRVAELEAFEKRIRDLLAEVEKKYQEQGETLIPAYFVHVSHVRRCMPESEVTDGD